MNTEEKLKQIMEVLSTEDYEIAYAIDREKRYITMSGQSVDSTDAMLTFGPIYTKCKQLYETPFHDTTNLTGEHMLS